MTNITRSEVLNNRKIWISHLLNPQTQKTTGKLEDADNPEARCCLGHACHLFMPDTKSINAFGTVQYSGHIASAPSEVVEKLGLYSPYGIPGSNEKHLYKGLPTLVDMNDNIALNISQAEIGLYLASVIEGGSHTPFRPLSDYPEEA